MRLSCGETEEVEVRRGLDRSGDHRTLMRERPEAGIEKGG